MSSRCQTDLFLDLLRSTDHDLLRDLRKPHYMLAGQGERERDREHSLRERERERAIKERRK